MKLGRGEHKLVKKQDLTWKSRMLLFQNPSWKTEKNERSKAILMFAKFDLEKISATACQAIEKKEKK
jgi:hypothetical protein